MWEKLNYSNVHIYTCTYTCTLTVNRLATVVGEWYVHAYTCIFGYSVCGKWRKCMFIYTLHNVYFLFLMFLFHVPIAHFLSVAGIAAKEQLIGLAVP